MRGAELDTLIALWWNKGRCGMATCQNKTGQDYLIERGLAREWWWW